MSDTPPIADVIADVSDARSWVEAEQVAGRRLDRRRTYTILDGEVFEDVRNTDVCSGCSDWGTRGDERGAGCSECGYTGRRFTVWGVPVDLSQPARIEE